MTIVAFNATAFKTRYPEFSAVSDSVLADCFLEAGLYLANTDNSPVQNVSTRAMLLNMLTAHIAFLYGKLSADSLPKPSGRVSEAVEGSVSVRTEYMLPGTHAWFTQTAYGSSFWQATSSLRGFRYMARPTVY